MAGLVSVVAEGAEHEVSMAWPVAIGATTFLLLLVALFVVTRFNPDR